MESTLRHDVSLVATNHERSTLPAQFGRLQILQWKNNLTGLSRVYNLFFIASIDKILVFEPHFPSQALGVSKIKIRLPVSSPGLPGHHSIDYPHAINQVLIEVLGNFEIIVVACDDGDVIAYYVKDIQRAIDCGVRKIRRGGQWDTGDGNLRPVLHENVGKSAWGLAVHRGARMLAVSANTKEITIYSFALTNQDGHSTSKDGKDNYTFDDIRESDDGSIFLYNRELSRRMTLRTDSAVSNIPNISFCNTPEDPHGRFLVSTNIVGVTTIWDLAHKCRVEELVMRTRSPRGVFEQWNLLMSGKHGGWNVLFLDKRSFRTVEPDYCMTADLFWDVNSGDAELESWAGSEDDDLEDTDTSGSEDAENETLPEEPQANVDEQSASPTNSSTHSGLFVKERPDYSESVNDRSQFWMGVLSDCGAGEQSLLPDCPILHTSIRDVFMLQPECDTWGRTRAACREDSGRPFEIMVNRVAPGLGPILSFDLSSELPQPFCPIQILHNPLKEALPFPSLITQFERLNMVDEIAELGIVVIGCGRGRVVIVQLIKHQIPWFGSMGAEYACSGIKHRKRQRTPGKLPPMGCSDTFEEGRLESVERFSSNGRGHKAYGWASQNQQVPNAILPPTRNSEIYTFRLAHRLPLPEQERPPLPLIGTAVGPVQGSKRRWRILLTYLDGTILSYEVCRAKDRGNGTAGVHEIYV